MSIRNSRQSSVKPIYKHRKKYMPNSLEETNLPVLLIPSNNPPQNYNICDQFVCEAQSKMIVGYSSLIMCAFRLTLTCLFNIFQSYVYFDLKSIEFSKRKGATFDSLSILVLNDS